jgi:uncharacterized membrane protein
MTEKSSREAGGLLFLALGLFIAVVYTLYGYTLPPAKPGNLASQIAGIHFLCGILLGSIIATCGLIRVFDSIDDYFRKIKEEERSRNYSDS